MEPRRTFRNPSVLPRSAVWDALERGISDRTAEEATAEALVGLALNDGEREYIERCCLAAGTRAEPGSQLLGLAGLCLGHVARRFGRLSDEAVALAESLAARAEADPSDVDSRALDGRDDIRWFLRGGL